MPEATGQVEPKQQVMAAREAFEQEFERFARFRPGNGEAIALTLEETEAALRDLDELRRQHTGKKSRLAAAKKMIGRISAEERPAFAQHVQQLETEIAQALVAAEQSLKD